VVDAPCVQLSIAASFVLMACLVLYSYCKQFKVCCLYPGACSTTKPCTCTRPKLMPPIVWPRCLCTSIQILHRCRGCCAHEIVMTPVIAWLLNQMSHVQVVEACMARLQEQALHAGMETTTSLQFGMPGQSSHCPPIWQNTGWKPCDSRASSCRT